MTAQEYFKQEWGGFTKATLHGEDTILEISMEDLYKTMEGYQAKENYKDEDLEKSTEYNIKVVSQFMDHCKREGHDLPNELFESFFGV